jgi:hypothetical protein
MAPATDAPPGPLRANVAAVKVEAFIASLNDAVMTETFIAPSTGLVDVTVGASVSGASGMGTVLDVIQPAATTNIAAIERAAKLRVWNFIEISSCYMRWCHAGPT